jgi:hypothetical protein
MIYRFQPTPEPAMNKNMRIVAETPKGRIEVRAGQGTSRHYFWKGGNKLVRMHPRGERWENGSLGLDNWDRNVHLAFIRSFLGFPNERVIQAEEGQLNFASEKKAFAH